MPPALYAKIVVAKWKTLHNEARLIMIYNKELKGAILEKVLAPNNKSSLKLARETGVNSSTIRRWKQDALKNRGGIALDKEKFTSHDKFAMTFGRVCP